METLLVINELDLTQEEIAKLPVVVKTRAVLVTQENALVMTCERGKNNIYIHGVPGGRLELGETDEEGLRREVKEETGYDCEILAELGCVDVVRYEYLSRTMFWLARTVGGQGTLAITDDECAVDFECIEYSFEQGRAIVKKEFDETKSDISERTLVALEKAKEILDTQ